MGVADFKPYDGVSPCIPEPGEAPEPDDTAGFAEPKKIDEKTAAVLVDAAGFYNDLLMSNEDRSRTFGIILPAGVSIRNAIREFKIGYAPPYSDEQHRGRALVTAFAPRFEKDDGAFEEFSDGGLIRFLNDATAKGYGYYWQQIDFTRKIRFQEITAIFLPDRSCFPIYDADASPAGIVGRRPDDRGVRWLKHQA